MNKQIENIEEILSSKTWDGMTIAVGGFGLCGIPEQSILALKNLNVKNLTIISNNCGIDDWGLGLLLKNQQIKKVICSYAGENKEFARQLLSGEVEIELVPQGTLAERIRAGGAGIPAFFTPSGAGTEAAVGKEVREFNGRPHIMELAITADLSLVRAHKGDNFGNLVYRKTARNFNPLIATCGKFSIAEVEDLVKVGDLNPDNIHTPGIYIDKIFSSPQEKRIEQLTLQQNQ
jgi:3-oxoacid CoA-transferase subunit A